MFDTIYFDKAYIYVTKMSEENFKKPPLLEEDS
ncbi:hypothetical protein C5S32_10070 [ANME-1 cluster archaeon GoMg1]|nr:hypothetical protein [ANME-1 cluster archaeon GoMg1]